MGDRFRGQRRGNPRGRGSGYDVGNGSQAIHINLVIPTQGPIAPTLNAPQPQNGDRVPFHDRRQPEEKLGRNQRQGHYQDRYHVSQSQPGLNSGRDHRSSPFPHPRYEQGGERPNPHFPPSQDFYRQPLPNNGREFVGGATDYFGPHERPRHFDRPHPTNMAYQDQLPSQFQRGQHANMANDIFPPERDSRAPAHGPFHAPPERSSGPVSQDIRFNNFHSPIADQRPPQAYPPPTYHGGGNFNGSHGERHPSGNNNPRYDRPPSYESHDFENRGNGGRFQHEERREFELNRGRGRGRGERGGRGGGRGGRSERGHQDIKDQTEGNDDDNKGRVSKESHRGQGGKKQRGRGRGGKSNVGTTKSRERSSSEESNGSVGSNCTGINLGQSSSHSVKSERNEGRGRGRGRGKGNWRGRGGKSNVGTTNSRERSSSEESNYSVSSNCTGISVGQSSNCSNSNEKKGNRGRGQGRGKGERRVPNTREKGKEGINNASHGKTRRGRGRGEQSHESKERSSSRESGHSFGIDSTGINSDKKINHAGDKGKQKQSYREKQVITKEKDSSEDSKNDELVQTKASITVKKCFDNADQLKELLKRHFKKKKSFGEMHFLEDATIFTEKETICIVTITSGSKQQAKRLIQNMCQGVYRELEVNCYFCVSSWKNETTKSAPVQRQDKDMKQSTNIPTKTSSSSAQTPCQEENKAKKEIRNSQSAMEKRKMFEQQSSKLAVTITKAFDNEQQLVAFLKSIAGKTSSKIPAKPNLVSLQMGLTLCEYVFADKADAEEISKVLNQEPGVKSTCIQSQKPTKKKQKVEKDIKIVIQEAVKQINDRVKEDLANANKVCQAGKSLRELQSKLSPQELDSEEGNVQEIDALMDKLRELESQKKEFENRVKKLTNSIENASCGKDVENVLRDVGIECKRLSAGLPMYARRRDLIEKVQSNQVSIILGETGSGKSTQLAQYLWEEGLAGDKQIVCTQPRKVAALTLAERVSSELVRKLGTLVGYKSGVRQNLNVDTKILFCTDHTLLNECLRDPLLSKYSCIIIDEAHERSIYTDILLGMIKSFLPQRPDLKLVITSATINPSVFIEYFQTSPELRVSGRAFPVDLVYDDSESSTSFESYEKKAVEKVIEIHESQRKGDILIFLTSAAEIMRCCEELTNRLKNRNDFVCFPLHGQLPPQEQKKVFEPLSEGKRKIIFSTNCAETSITIDGIKFVVDTGVVNEMRYDPRKNMSSLGTQIISQSSADQRKGRAGRTSSGTCYRLYTEANFDSMVTTNRPEILRVHLGQAVLKLAELGVDVRKYDFVESPEPEAIDSAICVLQELSALSLVDAGITEVGKWLSKLPFDPRQSYVVYLGHKEDLLYDAITLATLISNGSNMIYRGLNEAEEQVAARTKNRFGSVNGDLFMWLEIYKGWVELPKTEQTSWCRKNCINYKVLSLTKQTISEVRQTLTKEFDIKFEFNFSDREDSLDLLRHMVFEANLPSLCHYSGHKRAGYFTASTGHQVHPHPSSNLAIQNHYPEWILYLQLTKTSRDFIRGITKVEESWIESAIGSGKLPEDFFKVRSHKVETVFHKELGQTVFRSLVGPQFSKLRPLEESLADAGMASVVVEADKGLGAFDVLSSTAMHPQEAKVLNSAIEETVLQLRMENEELPLGQDKSGVRAVVGEGGSVTAVFMPDQSNKVVISMADSATTEETVRSKFSLFGKITGCVKFKKGQSWGFVKYSTFHEANNAVNGTLLDTKLRGKFMVNGPKQGRSNFEAKLSWCRRPIKGNGTAFIKCSPLEKSFLVGMTVNICGSVRCIKVANRRDNNDSNDLIIFGTGLAEEQEIKEAILREAYWDIKKEQLQVDVSRERVDVCPEKLKVYEKFLVTCFSEFVPRDKFSIRFLQPLERARYYVAFISFDNALNGFHACRALRNGGLFVMGQKVNISPDLKTSINIPKEIMQVCKKKFDQLKEAVEEDDIGVTLTFRQLQRGDFMANILTSDQESMVRMRAAIQKELEGDVINCCQNNLLRNLLKKQGMQFLHQLENKIKDVKIISNVKAEKVCIFGSEGSVTLATAEINKYLSELADGHHEEIPLREQGGPVGLLKAILLQFPDLRDDFVSKFNIQDVFIDYKRHTLSVVGSKDSIEKLKQTINNIQKNMPPVSQATGADRVLPDCITCMCPIEDFSELYRLERCGHSFCFTCLRMQLVVQTEDKQFPLACAEESCGKPWMWRDVQMCLKRGWLSPAKLVDRAVDAFVTARGGSYKFCTSPNCPVPYEVTDSDDGGEFSCPACQVSLCTSCHTAYHPGLTCKQDDLSFQDWLRQNRTRCKPCPKCAIPVEKIEGCNKMHCKCGAYFCWICLEKFDSEQSCYAHLAKKHGGFYDEN